MQKLPSPAPRPLKPAAGQQRRNVTAGVCLTADEWREARSQALARLDDEPGPRADLEREFGLSLRQIEDLIDFDPRTRFPYTSPDQQDDLRKVLGRIKQSLAPAHHPGKCTPVETEAFIYRQLWSCIWARVDALLLKAWEEVLETKRKRSDAVRTLDAALVGALAAGLSDSCHADAQALQASLQRDLAALGKIDAELRFCRRARRQPRLRDVRKTGLSYLPATTRATIELASFLGRATGSGRIRLNRSGHGLRRPNGRRLYGWIDELFLAFFPAAWYPDKGERRVNFARVQQRARPSVEIKLVDPRYGKRKGINLNLPRLLRRGYKTRSTRDDPPNWRPSPELLKRVRESAKNAPSISSVLKATTERRRKERIGPP